MHKPYALRLQKCLQIHVLRGFGVFYKYMCKSIHVYQ